MKYKDFNSLIKITRTHQFVFVILIITLLGGFFVVKDYADSPYASSEAESGTLAGSATVVSDSSASGDEAVQFGQPVSGNTCTDPVTSSSNVEFSWTADNGYFVNNNAWSGGAGPQTIYVCNYNSWYVASNQTDQGGAVETGPDTEDDLVSAPYQCTPPNCGPVVSSMTSLTSTFGVWDPPNTDIGYDDEYDTWIDGLNEGGSDQGNPTISDEVMVWNKWENDLNGYTPTYADVTIGGTAWDIYEQHLPSNGNPGLTIFAMVNQVSSGSVNLLALYNWTIANHPTWFYCTTTADCQAGGGNPAEISSIEYGMEVSWTDGSQDFGVNNFSVTVN